MISPLTRARLRSGDLLDCLDPPSRCHHNDLLTPGSSDNLLPGARCEDLLLSPTRLVDDDGLLPPHSGHLHTGLHLTADNPRPDGSDLSGSSR